MGHIDRATGRNKRDKVTVRENKAAPRRAGDGTGRIADRAASARKMKVERQLRKKGR